MRSSKPRDNNTHCFRCYMRRETCICPILPTVRTRTEFLILRHIWESERPSNTGRLAELAMPNARIIPCGGGDRIGLAPLDDTLLRASNTWLLWPDGAGAQPELPPPERIIVLDATWQQARRLYSRPPAFQAMPRLVLPVPDKSRKRLRDPHRADGMSTIEAVAAAVAVLEGKELAEPLERLYDEVVHRTNTLRWGMKTS
jgi:DTW domain-containing protein